MGDDNMGNPLPRFTRTDAGSSSAATSDARAEALRLMERRKDIDEEMEGYAGVLKTQNVTLTSPLVDAQSFPLANVDLVAVRTARSRIIALRNDRAALDERLKGLLEHALPPPSSSASAAGGSRTVNGARADLGEYGRAHGGATSNGMDADAAPSTPFAKVNSVASASPAEVAGLEVRDELLRFGSLDASNNDRLRALPSVVSEGTSIPVTVRRAGQIVELTLLPRLGWGGRGMLGCHIVPV